MTYPSEAPRERSTPSKEVPATHQELTVDATKENRGRIVKRLLEDAPKQDQWLDENFH